MSGIYDEVRAARAAAHAKHGENSIERVPASDPRWLSILVEEVGEVAHELTYDSTGDLRAELVQVAAVAIAWADAIDRFDSHPDHSGEVAPGTCCGCDECDVPLHVHGCWADRDCSRCDDPEDIGS